MFRFDFSLHFWCFLLFFFLLFALLRILLFGLLCQCSKASIFSGLCYVLLGSFNFPITIEYLSTRTLGKTSQILDEVGHLLSGGHKVITFIDPLGVFEVILNLGNSGLLLKAGTTCLVVLSSRFFLGGFE